jgi:hypothetical protein
VTGGAGPAFEAPWQARAFALAQAFPHDQFQPRLVEAIATDPDRPYWESWVAALEALIAAT